MDKRIKDLVEFTRDKYDLSQYNLHKWEIIRSISVLNETVYRLSMEWFPNHIEEWEDETFNPEGTANIEISIPSKNVKSIIFCRGKSFTNSMKFDLNNKDEIIKWIEKEAGLNYGEQFEDWREEEREIYFKVCIDGIEVSPSEYIQFKLDDNGKLIHFSIIGEFPDKKDIRQDLYVLSIAKVKELAKEQLKLIRFPVMEQKKLVSAYAIEEIYIKNDCSSTLPCEFFVYNKSRLQMDEVIEWEHQVQEPFQRRDITFEENDITPEQAFQCEPHPDLQPINEEEVNKCLSSIQMLLNQEYVNDSGKWVLKSLHRDKGYIHATLRQKKQNEGIFKRKLTLFIDSKNYEVVNYIDNMPFLEMYMELKEEEEIKIIKEDAFEKLIDLIELNPCYVYDSEQGYYVLCGMLDCNYAVNATNGEIVALSEL